MPCLQKPGSVFCLGIIRVKLRIEVYTAGFDSVHITGGIGPHLPLEIAVDIADIHPLCQRCPLWGKFKFTADRVIVLTHRNPR